MKFTKRSVTSAEVASATSLRQDGPTNYTGRAFKTAQLAPHCLEATPVLRVFCPICCMRPPSVDAMSGRIWTALCTPMVLLDCCFGRGGLQEFLTVDGGGAGRGAGAPGDSEMRRF